MSQQRGENKMYYSEDDNQIMENDAATMKDTAYPKYIKHRYLVIETHDTKGGMCATIADKELGTTSKFYEGDSIADGKIGEIQPNGLVVFKPPRAEVESFTLPSEMEMSPIEGHRRSKDRMRMDDDLKKRPQHGQAVVIISVDDAMEKGMV
jgi:hypothetical protein